MERWKAQVIVYGISGMTIAGMLGLVGYIVYPGNEQSNEQVSSQEQTLEKPQEKPKPAPFAAVPMYSEGAMPLISGDFDGDKDLDFIAASYNNQWVIYFGRNQGDGSFDSPLKVGEVSQSSQTGMGLTPGDFDADGDLDFKVGNCYSGRSYLFENDGQGNFTLYAP